jgi:non-ribosomal peptide synthase protein (TIGR01720 family)
MVYFSAGARPGRLLLVAHHLVMDAVSWRILMADFRTIYQALANGQPVRLPPKTMSYQAYANQLATLAASGYLQAEAAYWRAQTRPDSPWSGPASGSARALEEGDRREAAYAWVAPAMPVDFPGGSNQEGAAAKVHFQLTAEETAALSAAGPIQACLLAALAEAWRLWSGVGTLQVWLEGHGRSAQLLGADGQAQFGDVSRTVGWFTSLYPLRLETLPAAANAPAGFLPLRDPQGARRAVRIVQEALQAVPNGGIGYGLLRYLSPEMGDGGLDGLQTDDVALSFNYLGHVEGRGLGGGARQVEDEWFGAAPENSGPPHAPEAQRTAILEVNGGIFGGQLGLDWTYSSQLHRPESIARLVDYFGAALAVLRQSSQAQISPVQGAPETSILGKALDAPLDGETETQHPQPASLRESAGADAALSASEFPLAGLSQAQLDQLMARHTRPGKPKAGKPNAKS